MQYEGLYAVNVQSRRLGILARKTIQLARIIIHGTNADFVE